MGTIIEWLLKVLGRERFDIGRGDDDGDYLTRWTLIGKRFTGRYRVFLHRFRRSDLDTFHDHPWPFVSLIVAGGYHERTPKGRRWYGPGRILKRPATWAHKVEIAPGRECWTIVVTGLKVRTWGFHCPAGWRSHKDADAALRTKGNVCAEARS